MKDYTIVQLQKDCERKRCRRWRIDLKDGRYPNGKQKYKSQRFEGTYTQAVARAEELSEDRSRLRSHWTVETYFNHINDTKLATGEIRQRTHDHNIGLMKHVFEMIGGYSVSEVKPSDIEKVYVKLRETPTRLGEGWSGTSILGVAKVLRAMFERARKEKLIASNPVDDALRPKSDTKEKEAMAFEDAVAFEAALDPTDRRQLAILIAMEAGLRIGEICGLTWDDIEDGYVHVRRTMHANGEVGEPKTPSSKRVVPVSSTLAEALEAAPRYSQWVVGNKLGQPLSPTSAATWWAKNRDDFGLPGWTLHQFRHQFATNLARQGVNPRTMQNLLGHASPMVSLQIYTHVEKEQTVDAIAQIEAARRLVLEQREAGGGRQEAAQQDAAQPHATACDPAA